MNPGIHQSTYLPAWWILACLVLIGSGCEVSAIPPQSAGNETQSATQTVDSIKILFLGNSHTSTYGVPELFSKIWKATPGQPNLKVKMSTGAFLDNLAARREVVDSIKNEGWDYVVLQGQKISMSGRYHYSTEAAESLADLVNQCGGQVVWFCEWARKDVQGERERIKHVYQTLSEKHGDRLALVGDAWDKILQAQPEWNLHHQDGNHANQTGAFVAALAIYRTISQKSCEKVPAIQGIGIEKDQQAILAQLVDDAIPIPEPATTKKEVGK